MPKAPRGRPAERYRLKYSRLRRAARALVFENGALCDEVARLEAKCLRARDERRFLLTRLLQLRALAGPRRPGGAEGRPGGGRNGVRPTGSRDELRPTGSRDDARPAASREGLRPAGSRDAPLDDPARPNGPRGASKVAAAAPADLRPPEEAANLAGPPAAILSSSPRRRGGAPALPLSLGPLTVHSLGVVGAGAAAILPPGYRSTRLFASLRRPARRCLYTCRIVAGPRCEIVAEDEPGRVLAGPTPDVCHARLLQALEEAGRPRGPPHVPGAGEDFFGLTHPVVRRHLQGEAGAFIHPEEEEDEEEDDDDDDDDEDDEEEEEEEGAAQAFPYGDIFLGSPTGSDD
ncbi:LOW QUALITY PROTEIN: transforming growth factor beta regulator 1-like [Mergus octosetaceus]